MIIDTDEQIKDKSTQLTNLLQDLRLATMFAISEIDKDYWYGCINVWLNFNIRGKQGLIVTPILNIRTGFNAYNCRNKELSDIQLDIKDIYDRVTKRLTLDNLTWDDVELDIYKKHVNDGYIAPILKK